MRDVMWGKRREIRRKVFVFTLCACGVGRVKREQARVQPNSEREKCETPKQSRGRKLNARESSGLT